MSAVPDVVPENTRQILEGSAESHNEFPYMAGHQSEGTTELQEEEHMKN